LLIYSAKWHMPPGWLLQHLLFLDAKTFFWTVKIEVIFYFLLPFIGLVSCLIRSTLPKFLVLVAITLAYHFLVQVPGLVTVRAAVTTVPLWLSPFMMGICASVIAPYLSKPIGYACLVAGFVALAVFNFDLPSFVHIRDFLLGVHPGPNGPFVFVGATALMATLFVTGAAVIPPNFLFCNRIIRTAGVCGYSFYLWQILVMQLLTGAFDIPSKPLLFALVAVLTYFVSIVSFALIELPAMNYGHAVARRLIEGRAGAAAREPA
jgi:peptidoglycan/LPS O-acetylase OafA/YrhL